MHNRIKKNVIYIVLLIIITAPFNSFAQNGGSWEPEQVFTGDTLTIYFDASQSAEMPNSNATMVLHWGVNETGSGNWQAPDSSTWPGGTVLSGVAARSPMNKVGATLWQIKIKTNSTISTLHFVFNNGTPSNYGENWAHSDGAGANWNIDLFQGALTALFLKPQVNNAFSDPRRSPLFIGADDTVAIEGSAVISGVTIDSLALFVENRKILLETVRDTLSYTFNAADYGRGMFPIQLVVYASSGETDTARFYYMIDPQAAEKNPPAGVRAGINYWDDGRVTLALFAPYKEHVFVIGEFNNWFVDTLYLMNKYSPTADSTLWWLTIDGLTAQKEYAFQYLVNGTLRIADPYTEKVLNPWDDPWIDESTYPNLKAYPSGKTDEIVSVLQTEQTEYAWQATDYQPPAKEELIIYELLIRDFVTAHDYKTLIDTLDYLENLGINAIELMPVNEFEGNESWGYNPAFYFAPDKYYGPAEDLKAFVDACHQRGIAVIVDMVLNHCFGQSPFVQLYLDHYGSNEIIMKIPNPWFNQSSPNQTYRWGADFNHQSPATQKLVDRVNSYWLTEFNVDGFRFDFTKGFTNTPGDGGGYDASRISILERMADKLWEVNPLAYVILEHFAENSEERELSNYGMMVWGNSNYNYNEATMGWNNNSDFSWGFYKTRGWSKPGLVTYMESNDEERLMYKNLEYGNSDGSYDIKNVSIALNRQKLAGAFFFTLPGPKMIWQFGELGYDFSIDYNGRVGNKPIRWDYMENGERKKLYKTWAALLKLRRETATFKNSNSIVSLAVSGAGKRISIINSAMSASIVGNFGVTATSVNPNFNTTGTWYDYFSGDSMVVINKTEPIPLEPGAFHIYTNKKLQTPEKGLLTGLKTDKPELPLQFSLGQNYPNPFNPETVIHYELPQAEYVELSVYNLLGQKVQTLVSRNRQAGHHSVTLKAFGMASGLYIYQIKAGHFVQTRKMILLR